mmetsp:Transcript_58946/g.138615  ORF Transcript_58946/g.138615 Transcript_58946/m.138615 type:complete len:237 (+) Transcript_58946:134-844(+)
MPLPLQSSWSSQRLSQFSPNKPSSHSLQCSPTNPGAHRHVSSPRQIPCPLHVATGSHWEGMSQCSPRYPSAHREQVSPAKPGKHSHSPWPMQKPFPEHESLSLQYVSHLGPYMLSSHSLQSPVNPGQQSQFPSRLHAPRPWQSIWSSQRGPSAGGGHSGLGFPSARKSPKHQRSCKASNEASQTSCQTPDRSWHWNPVWVQEYSPQRAKRGGGTCCGQPTSITMRSHEWLSRKYEW